MPAEPGKKRRRAVAPAALAVTLLVTASGCPESDDPPFPDGGEGLVDAQIDAPMPIDAPIDGPDGPPPFD